MQEWIDKLKDLIKNNQIMATGAVVGVGYAVVAWLKQVPKIIYQWIRGRLVIDVEVRDDDEAFYWVSLWLADHESITRRSRNLSAKAVRENTATIGNRPKVHFIPGLGTHWIWHTRHLIMVSRTRDPETGKSSGGKESIRMSFLCRDKTFVVKVFNEAICKVHPSAAQKLCILLPQYGYWNRSTYCRPRTMESVIMPFGVGEAAIAEVTRFFARKKWYEDNYVPWRFGILLSGIPGSGKSSLVKALASHFQLDIAVLNLQESSMDDGQLLRLLASLPRRTLLLLEDVDCVTVSRDAVKDKPEELQATQGAQSHPNPAAPTAVAAKTGVSLSGLLNGLDGVTDSDGRLLVMTTNHPDRLDSALIRPSRISLRIDLQLPDQDQIGRLIDRFFPEANNRELMHLAELIHSRYPISMAGVQDHLIRYLDDGIAGATAKVDDLRELCLTHERK